MNEFNITKTSLSLISKINVSIYGKIPKSHSVYRNRILECAFDLHENLITANVFSGSARIKHQKLAMVNIYELDMLLGLINDMSLIDSGAFMSSINILNNLRKMVLGWIKSEENKK